MSRRDTIIVAVLINAGLLIVLFATAVKSGSDSEFVAAPPPKSQESSSFGFKQETVLTSGDEVDVALNQFSQKAVAVQSAPEPTPAPVVSSFAEDLAIVADPAPTPTVQAPTVRTLTTPVAPPVKTTLDFIEIRVKKGDVLEKIARHHHSTVAEVMRVNALTSTNLRIGQVLKIPNKSMKKAEAATIAHKTPAAQGQAQYYTVKKGDSPWTIAMKNHMKVEELLQLNSMSQEQARRLKPGDQLRIQ